MAGAGCDIGADSFADFVAVKSGKDQVEPVTFCALRELLLDEHHIFPTAAK